jgi:hypothetical protein
MIAFSHRLNAEQSEAIRQYVIKRSHDRVKELADTGAINEGSPVEAQ